jgi:hypothetical protein
MFVVIVSVPVSGVVGLVATGTVAVSVIMAVAPGLTVPMADPLIENTVALSTLAEYVTGTGPEFTTA